MDLRVAENILDLVGNTPLVRLTRVTKDMKATVYAKLEFFNPGGSVKDRIGLAMILDAERRGLLKPGGTIVEPTSGNTGMGLALAAIQRGYKIVFTVPDKMSRDKIDLLRAVGAEVRVTPTNVPQGHPANYISLSKRIARETPNSYMPNQYENPANPAAHYASTGPEIWSQTGGRVDVVVAGVGTGGTISGTGKYLKERNPSVRVVGVDPEGSILASRFAGKRGRARPYRVEGIGEDFLPRTLDMGVIDEFVTVSDRAAMLMTRRLAREEGIVAGTSSGAAVYGALKVARGLKGHKVVVVILPDTGRSYLNKVYNDAWMSEHEFLATPRRRLPVKALLESKERRHSALLTATPDEDLSKASRLMARRRVSFLPVVDHGVQIGSITASALLGRMKGRLSSVTVREVMEPPLPSIDMAGSVSLPGSLLGGRGAVVVTERQKPVDILTAMDVVRYLDQK